MLGNDRQHNYGIMDTMTMHFHFSQCLYTNTTTILKLEVQRAQNSQ